MKNEEKKILEILNFRKKKSKVENPMKKIVRFEKCQKKKSWLLKNAKKKILEIINFRKKSQNLENPQGKKLYESKSVTKKSW